jgi:hypothetical protein
MAPWSKGMERQGGSTSLVLKEQSKADYDSIEERTSKSISMEREIMIEWNAQTTISLE